MFSKHRPIKVLATVLFMVIASFATSSLASAVNKPAVPFQSPQTSHTEYEEWRIAELINIDRVSHGLRPLTMQYNLHQYGRFHANNQAAHGSLWHDMGSFGRSVPGGSTLWGENVAYNYSIEAAHEALMKSPGHRANILDPRYTHIGVGVRYTADGRVFVSENFAAVTPVR